MLGPSELLWKSMDAGTSESEQSNCFSNVIDFPKIGILEVDKPKPIPKLAQDGNDENFTKKASAGKKCCSLRKSGLEPLYLSFEKAWGPKLGLRQILEKYVFPSGT